MTDPRQNEADQAAHPASWQLDPQASSVVFSHKAMWGLATVRSAFTGITGSGEIEPDGSGHGRLVIDAASFDTKNNTRDKHLRSADFFGTEQHPQIVADIAVAKRQDDDHAAVTGTLTVAGVTRPLSLTAQITESGDNALTLRADTEIDRADFGMTWNQLGTIRGKATVSVVARFVKSPAVS